MDVCHNKIGCHIMITDNSMNELFLYKPSDENETYKKIFPRFTFSDVKDGFGNVIQEFIFSKPVEGYKNKINASQCGSGKTTEVIEDMNTNVQGKDLIISNAHDLLYEIQSKINKPFVHLEGFKRLCLKIKDDSKDGRALKELSETEIPKRQLCKIFCGNNKCGYSSQFAEAAKEGVSVGMTVDFINSYDFDVFDNVYIEEAVSRETILSYHPNRLVMMELSKLRNGRNPNKYITLDEFTEINHAIREKDIDKLKYWDEKISDAVSTYNYIIITNFRKNTKNDIHTGICKLNIEKMLMYIEFETRMKEAKIDRYSNDLIIIPNQQMLFYKQMQNDKELKYNCATFNKLEFFRNLETFEEMFPEFTAQVSIAHTNRTNCETPKIKHYGEELLGSAKFDQNFAKIKPKVVKLIDNLKNRKHKKVCILTFKQNVKDGKFLGCDAFYFGGSHGCNKWRDYNCMIVIGTFLPNTKNVKEYFNKIYPDEPIPNLSYYETFGVKVPKDDLMRAYYMDFYENDVLDCVHRARPLEKLDMEVYWFGKNIPRQLVKELGVEEGKF